MENLTIIRHALIQRNLTALRDRRTSHGEFRRLLHQTAALLAYEVLRDLPVRPVPIETPLEPTVGYVLDTEVIVVPILRAGLGMVDGFVQYLPEARIGHLGMYRDEATHRPVDYYAKLPPGLEEAWVILVDPMLATGGSADDALSALKARGARQLRFACLVAAPEGVRRLADRHPDVRIYAAALDRELNRSAFILPGLGDAGDRAFGT
ncbi:MAG: uracil phosphoribosyltransferase [Bacteroidetes bacterium]|nr:uracil phosphoribosyltransferase [Rhodothermia bacterium]MCS7155287.1 uracil phosphoribosyltransferase [Bacteroidota bacterium]MCX7907872.1 uracil phosphoribosyltransferase [Bacteroidota bacterium]MDW8138691.1 uracil phosphoribosyltransferase [Bacteroidota bacterium]MDW8284723.1 uracil phosphoribosyltransferase [Bacteroidota bacterium]